MSYCRFGWDGSDVYVFHHVGGFLDCCGCLLQKREWVDAPDYPIFKGYFQAVEPIIETHFTSRTAMIEHLREHQAQGHHVPEYVFTELQREIETEGDEVE